MHELLDQLLALFKDLPGFLDAFIQDHGPWVYALLFAIIFAETGLVILPFLPGDSLLFTVGALAARGSMNVWLISLALFAAAVLGDAVNYHLGKAIGPKIFRGESNVGLFGRLLNRKHLDRAHAFFERYGGKAVILGRFVPIVRTFVPFVAGAGAMNYARFGLYNVVGAVAWVGLCVGAGYIFGNIEWVQRHFEAVVLAIIVVSVLPVVFEVVAANRKKPAPSAPG